MATWYAAATGGVQIPIVHNYVGGPLSNYAAYMPLTQLPAWFLPLSNYPADYRDIRCTLGDFTTGLNLDRSGAVGELHISVPSVLSSVDTPVQFWIGDPSWTSMPTTASQQAVWVNEAGVWHLNETPTGSVGDFKDSTANAYNSSNTTGQPTRGTGIIGYAPSFNGSQYLNMGGGLAGSGARTVSAWAKISATMDGGGIAGCGSAGTASAATVLMASTSGVHNYSASVLFADLRSTVLATDNAWHLIVGVFSVGNMYLYVDGVGYGFAACTWSVDGTFTLGRTHVGGAWLYITGLVDEVRLSSVARTAGDVLTQYNNQSSPSTFWGTPVTLSKSGFGPWLLVPDFPWTRRMRSF